MARRSGPALSFRQKRPSPSRTPEEREWRTQQRYLKVLREVKEECGDTALSSDEEGERPGRWEGLSCWVYSGSLRCGGGQWSPFTSPARSGPLVCRGWASLLGGA